LTPSIWHTASITTLTGAGGFFMLLTCSVVQRREQLSGVAFQQAMAGLQHINST
jgi:hypothetical protein